MGNCFQKEEKVIYVRDYNSENVDEAEVDALLERIQAKVKIEKDQEAKFQAGIKDLERRVNLLSVPKRRMRLRKSASKRKTKKTRSQNAKKTEKKGKGVKNYLGNILSNVTDSVKNTGKAVLYPIGKKAKKVVKK